MHPRTAPSNRKEKSRRSPTFNFKVDRLYADSLTHLVNEVPEGLVDKSAIFDALQRRDAGKLIALADEIAATVYAAPAEHRRAHQFSAFVRKYPFSGSWQNLPDPEKAALASFDQSEVRCRRYNKYFRKQRLIFERYSHEKHLMRSWIRYILGDQPDLPRIYGKCGFGPGAAIGVGGNDTSFLRKIYAEKGSCSPAAFPYVCSSLSPSYHQQMAEFLTWDASSDAPPLPEDTHFAWAVLGGEEFLSVEWVNYNKIVTVPKTAKSARTIAVEPLWNSWIQKGIDEEMRLRLQRAGLDLRDQSINQRLAQAGSSSWDDPDCFCTIDLSSASDTIATEVVRELLPPEWFALLNATRSTHYCIGKGPAKRYEKFASMGNGFCFPLETLIFAAIVHAAAPSAQPQKDFVVYGDDIICRRSAFPKVLELLKHFGFVPNPRKTFSEGPFRESCGEDYWGGEPVRPLFLDEAPETLVALFKLHNDLKVLDAPLELLRNIRNCVKPNWRFVRFRHSPDPTAFNVERDEFMSSPLVRWFAPEQRWSWKELLLRPVSSRVFGDHRYSQVVYMAALRGASSELPFAVRRKTRTAARWA